MALPREIRDRIYQFSLTVGAEIVAHPTHYEKPTDFGAKGVNRPAVAVLRVNKRISEEAVSCFMAITPGGARLTGNGLNLRYMRSMAISFDKSQSI